MPQTVPKNIYEGNDIHTVKNNKTVKGMRTSRDNKKQKQIHEDFGY